jgi:hypothetical protein
MAQIISPVTFLVFLFSDNVNVHEAHDNGSWYNLGFLLGVAIVFGADQGACAGARIIRGTAGQGGTRAKRSPTVTSGASRRRSTARWDLL